MLAARRGAHALGAEQILDRQRQAFERAALAFRQPRVGSRGHRQRLFRRLGDEGVERARLFDRRDKAAVNSRRGNLSGLQRVARLGQGHGNRIAHADTLTDKGFS